MKKEEVFQKVKEAYSKMGVVISDEYECYALDHEMLRQEENPIDVKGNVLKEEKKGTWTKAHSTNVVELVFLYMNDPFFVVNFILIAAFTGIAYCDERESFRSRVSVYVGGYDAASGKKVGTNFTGYSNNLCIRIAVEFAIIFDFILGINFFSDAPFEDDMSGYMIIRCGKMKFMEAQIVYIFFLGILCDKVYRMDGGKLS